MYIPCSWHIIIKKASGSNWLPNEWRLTKEEMKEV
jgi:hypothetical protein